jgi:multidrug resistance efflux pump
MVKRVFIIFIFNLSIYAETYYAKLEPIDTITIKSEVNGKVVEAKSELEGKIVDGLIVKIDDKIDRLDLKNSIESLKLVNKMIEVNQNIIPMLKKSFLKKRELYQKVAPLSSSSISQKDSLYSAYVSAKSQYSTLLEKILNLKNQRVSLKQKIAVLKDRIEKKSIVVKNRYLYSLNVKSGEYVNIGMPIATIQDISKAKLVVYLSYDDIKDLDKKKIYLDGRETNLKFFKVWKVADKQNISSYRAEIILKPFTTFSKLIKVEVK